MRTLTVAAIAASIAIFALKSVHAEARADVVRHPPAVSDTVPAPGSTGARLTAPISVTFTRPMRRATLTAATFVVDGAGGVVAYDAASRTATFTPTANLAPDTVYTVKITRGARSRAGLRLRREFLWSFTTGVAADITPIYSFDGVHGADPKGSLTLVDLASGPTLFGRTSFGGPAWESTDASLCTKASTDPSKCPGAGVIFSIPASSNPNINVFPFDATTGYQPHHDSMLLFNSTLFGASLYTGTDFEKNDGNGEAFEFGPATFSFSSLHSFAGYSADGANSHSAFGAGNDGETIYGATALGGAVSGSSYTGCDNSTPGCGTIYCVDTTNDTAGSCYDSASQLPYRVLYSFQNGTGASASPCVNCTGAAPHGRPVAVNIGTAAAPLDILFGITRQGGIANDGNTAGNGTVYAFAPSTGTYTVLHLFAGQNEANLGASDGAFTDHGNLAVGKFVAATAKSPAQVTLYAMTTNGGSATVGKCAASAPGCGVIFSIAVDIPAPPAAPSVAAYSILHNFAAAAATDLVAQTSEPDGYNPYGSLLYSGGWLYGMTRGGGANNGGVIFRASPDASCAGSTAPSCYGLMGSFESAKQGDTDLTGSNPIDNLIASEDGSVLYGMTQAGGANDPQNNQQVISFGTVFAIFAIP